MRNAEEAGSAWRPSIRNDRACATGAIFIGLGGRRNGAAGQRYHRPLSLLLVDHRNHFKSVNDRFGHDAGDRAPRRRWPIALQVDRRRRGTDCRPGVGGEEFVLLLPETDAEKAATVADCICAAIRDETIRAGDGRSACRSASARRPPRSACPAWRR